jgi:hypothetical protein
MTTPTKPDPLRSSTGPDPLPKGFQLTEAIAVYGFPGDPPDYRRVLDRKVPETGLLPQFIDLSYTEMVLGVVYNRVAKAHYSHFREGFHYYRVREST